MFLIYLYKLLRAEGANDGLVSVESQRWGQFLGIVQANHLELRNWYEVIDDSRKEKKKKKRSPDMRTGICIQMQSLMH